MLIVTETPRLIVRTWQESDLKPYGELTGINNLPDHYSDYCPSSKPENELWRYQLELDQRGWSRWAIVHKESYRLIGYCGFSQYGENIELSWRFLPEFRGKGLVVEAAEAVSQLGFKRLGFKEIISYTASDNDFALGVIETLGMHLEGFEGWNNITVARYSRTPS